MNHETSILQSALKVGNEWCTAGFSEPISRCWAMFIKWQTDDVIVGRCMSFHLTYKGLAVSWFIFCNKTSSLWVILCVIYSLIYSKIPSSRKSMYMCLYWNLNKTLNSRERKIVKEHIFNVPSSIVPILEQHLAVHNQNHKVEPLWRDVKKKKKST